MQEVVLVVCAVAGVAAAMLLRRRSGRGSSGSYTEKDRLASERDMLLKSISKLEEDPGYAAERNALLPSYKSRLREIEAAMAGEARPKSAGKAGAAASGATAGSLPDVADPAKVATKEAEAVPESTVASDTPEDARDGAVVEDVKAEAGEEPVKVEAVVDGGGEASTGEIVPDDVKAEAGEEPVKVEAVVDGGGEASTGEIVPDDVKAEAGEEPVKVEAAETGAAPEMAAADDKPDGEQVMDEPRITKPGPVEEEVRKASQSAGTAPKADETGATEPAKAQDAPAGPEANKPSPPSEGGDKTGTGAGTDGGDDDGVDPDEDNLDKIKGDIMKALSKLERTEAD